MPSVTAAVTSSASWLAGAHGTVHGRLGRSSAGMEPSSAPPTLARPIASNSRFGCGAGLRLGFVANFISDPVLTGFKAGVAVVIVLDQLPKLLGIHFPKGAFFHNVLATVTGIPHASAATVAVGAITVGILVAIAHFFPRAPAPLIAVACGIGGVSLLGLQFHGVDIVGRVPTGFPSVTMPDLSLVASLGPAAAGIALMSFTETIASGRAFVESGERNDRHPRRSVPRPGGPGWRHGRPAESLCNADVTGRGHPHARRAPRWCSR